MSTEKMNFSNIKNVLNRDEMKKVMAGANRNCNGRNCPCKSNRDCPRHHGCGGGQCLAL